MFQQLSVPFPAAVPAVERLMRVASNWGREAVADLASPDTVWQLAAIVVAWFSRQREYRADAGAAALMGRKQPMINALARLGGMDPGQLPQTVQNMGISSRPSGLMALFSSHPPIEDRIRALQQQQGQ